MFVLLFPVTGGSGMKLDNGWDGQPILVASRIEVGSWKWKRAAEGGASYNSSAMPKELTHWMIARAASLKADGNASPRTTQALGACPQAFLLGAVAYDGPFYMPKDARMASLGAKLHGKGVRDAYAPIKRILAGGNTSSAIAFAAGALSHIAADTTFHPAVFYFTGFASHPDVEISGAHMFRHRAFEAAMDLHLLAEHGPGIERKVKNLFARVAARPDAMELLGALARFYAAEEQTPSEKEAAHIVHQAGRTQSLFSSASVRVLARLLNIRKAGTNSDISGLFYNRSSQWNSYFTSPRLYRDPVSGEEGMFDVREFFERAVDRALLLFRALERAVAGDADVFPYPGPNLDSGHPVDENQVMKYCDSALTETVARPTS
jgi:hypothetical protein